MVVLRDGCGASTSLQNFASVATFVPTAKAIPFAGRETKKALVVLLRWVLIIACAALILFTERPSQNASVPHAVILFLICSNILLATLPDSLFASRYFDHCLVIVDIFLITGSIWLAGQMSSDLYLLYFLIIMIAAVGETLYVILWSASLVAVVYLLVVNSISGQGNVLAPEFLLRVPFFFVVALFYGYFTQVVRSERSEKVEFRKQLRETQRIRELTAQLSRSLDRDTILSTLVVAVRDVCGVRYCAVLSRGTGTLCAEAGESNIASAKRRSSLFLGALERRLPSGMINGSVRRTPQPAVEQGEDPSRAEQAFSSKDLHFMPLSGGNDSDLFLVFLGDVDRETADYAALLMVSAVMALNNAGQYQALLHEVEKRQEVVKQLGSALEFKSEFVANISHELRTPIYSFIGFAELLVSGGYGELSDEQQKVVNRMLENAESLLELINNILDHAKMEAGQFNVRCTQKHLDSFIRDIVDTCRPLLKDKPVTLHSICPEEMPVVVTDWSILRQIALNLVSNAVKFTESGRVELHAGFDEASQALFMRVRDTGVGIPPEKCTQIFEPFRQLETSYTKKYAGTGLGLAITKKQIEMLGGSISVESERGKGSCFTVLLPMKFDRREQGGVKLLSAVVAEEPVHAPPPA
ncbi:MAG: HAMP domain-containing histidine kinase [Bdellovibrionales bacterium]|nr:HAMP domain-containing histidine kinase [Bdellovibrionales bacterium]